MEETNKAEMTYREFSDICKANGGCWRSGNVFAFAHTRIALGAGGRFLTRFNHIGTQTRKAATAENLLNLIQEFPKVAKELEAISDQLGAEQD